MILSAQNVNKRYGKRVVLRLLNHDKYRAMLADSGTERRRKVDIVRFLALLEQADSGKVIHGDRNWDASRLIKTSAYPFLTLVFQQLFLWPNLTMGENISIALTRQKMAPCPRRQWRCWRGSRSRNS